MDSETKKAVCWIVEDLLERIDRPPARNCTCHISPPCNDCVEYSGIREAIESAEEFIQEMSRLGTSAAEASTAFQGLQEESKDLVDLEIVIPGPEASAANLLSAGFTVYRPPVGMKMHPTVLYGIHADLVRASTATGHTPKELREMSSKDFQLLQDLQRVAQPMFDLEQIRKDAELLASIHAEPREPWYKRLWSWLRGTK